MIEESQDVDMPSEFQIVNERVVITKYIEPVLESDITQMSAEVEAFARRSSQSILAIADFGDIKQFPTSLLSRGIRRDNVNPMRNPKIERLLVIADSAFLQSVVSAVCRITGVKKVAIMRTRAEVDVVIEAFINNKSYELQSN
jgi:hypothetical protein